jgi:hypothetical protein
MNGLLQEKKSIYFLKVVIGLKIVTGLNIFFTYFIKIVGIYLSTMNGFYCFKIPNLNSEFPYKNFWA